MGNKFHAKKVETKDGVFDSKKEYAYFMQLRQMQKAIDPKRRVVEIRRQVRYDVNVNNKFICFYKLDFQVTYADGRTEFVDIKGLKKGSAYQNFRLKKKLVEAIYDIEIIEI
jgi:hypothetical protein